MMRNNRSMPPRSPAIRASQSIEPDEPLRIDGVLHDLTAASARLILDASSPNTRRAYRSDWNTWLDWCAEEHVNPMPADPATLANYIAHRLDTGAAATSVTRAMSAIRRAHLTAGHPPPTEHPVVQLALQGMRRTHTIDPHQAAPISIEMLGNMGRQSILHAANPAIRLRDHCIVVLGWWSALRRSNLTELDIEDITFHGPIEHRTMTLRVRSTKTEHGGHLQGHTRCEPGWIDPVAVTARWIMELGFAGIRTGPLFRPVDALGRIGHDPLHPSSIRTIVKRLAEQCGQPPERYSAHSLRAGFVTAARDAGVPDHLIMERTRHRRIDTLATYTRLSDATDVGDRISAILGAKETQRS